MPHNFKLAIAGAHYISKVGNQLSATPTDPNTPKVSPNGATVVNTIIGAGVYKDVFVLGGGISKNYFGDGKVVLSATGQLSLNTSSAGLSCALTNIQCNLNGFLLNLGTQGLYGLTDCIFINGTVSGAGGTVKTQLRNIWDNFTGTLTSTSTNTIDYCMFFNSSITWTGAVLANTSFKNNYVDTATVITWNNYVTYLSSFTNNNFRGLLQVNGVLYELKFLKDKVTVRPDANPNIADLATIDATVYDRGNFAQEPEFLNLEKLDYWSVSNTSPMLFADSTGVGNIANVNYSVVTKATDTAFASGAITDLTTSTGDFIVNSPANVGNVLSQPIQIAPIPQAIGTINLAELLNFNSAESLGSAENKNVTIVDNYDFASLDLVEQAGANPRRLTYQMRWSNKETIPLVDSDWDNQNYITVGEFGKFEHFTKPLVDVNGKGNGEPDFNGTSAAGIKAKWVQFRIVIRNGIGV